MRQLALATVVFLAGCPQSNEDDPATEFEAPRGRDTDGAVGARCGDGERNGSEACDRADLGGASCDRNAEGILRRPTCTEDCRLDTSTCEAPALPPAVCGNGLIEEGEECDTVPAPNDTCERYNYDGGQISCLRDCSLDLSRCTSDDPCAGTRCDDECDGDTLVTARRVNPDCSCSGGTRSPCEGACIDDADLAHCEGCIPRLTRECQGDEVRERDGCGVDRVVERCVGNDRCVSGECVCQPGRLENYCRGAGEVWVRDGCDVDRFQTQCRAQEMCEGGICVCQPRPESYCRGDEAWERDGCDIDRRVDACDHGCANGSCIGCVPRPELYCAGDAVWERDGCGQMREVDICRDNERCVDAGCVCQPGALDTYCRGDEVWQRDGCTDVRLRGCPDGCALGECQEPELICEDVLACVDAGMRRGDGNADNDIGEVLRLRLLDPLTCDRIRLELTKVDGSNIGDATYTLRVGTCAAHGAQRDSERIANVRSFVFTTDFRGQAGDEKNFCVTRPDGPHAVWWWSNQVVIDGIDDQVCE